MLETYFVKPRRPTGSGPAGSAQRSSAMPLASRAGYSTRTVRRHVQALMAFGEFARRRGASALADLPAHVDDFVAMRAAAYGRGRAGRYRGPRPGRADADGDPARLRAHQPDAPRAALRPRGAGVLRVPGRRARPAPAVDRVLPASPGRFEAYLDRIGITGLQDLSPALLSAFIAERAGAGLARTTVRPCCAALRVFLRYAHRQGVLASDLSKAVEWPPAYQLADMPRSISWEQVGQVLGSVDRRTPAASAITRSCCCWRPTGCGPARSRP